MFTQLIAKRHLLGAVSEVLYHKVRLVSRLEAMLALCRRRYAWWIVEIQFPVFSHSSLLL